MTSRQLQCHANVVTALRHHGLTVGPLLRVEEDRCVFACGADLADALDAHPEFSRWPFCANHGPDAYASWRENIGSCSMQITLHRRDGHTEAEIDFDYGNPGWDLVSLATHAWEFAHNCIFKLGRTNPYRVREKLNARGYGIPKVKEV